MKYVAIAAAFLASLMLVGVLAAVIVVVFAGPHSDFLPEPLQIVVYLASVLAVLVIPVWVARIVWRRIQAH